MVWKYGTLILPLLFNLYIPNAILCCDLVIDLGLLCLKTFRKISAIKVYNIRCFISCVYPISSLPLAENRYCTFIISTCIRPSAKYEVLLC